MFKDRELQQGVSRLTTRCHLHARLLESERTFCPTNKIHGISNETNVQHLLSMMEDLCCCGSENLHGHLTTQIHILQKPVGGAEEKRASERAQASGRSRHCSKWSGQRSLFMIQPCEMLRAAMLATT
ncbi:hypothetical protein GOODEAATRI_029794 [Goodea atripinnis]|uniref:Uncharacterized protein n=1 Tax=Goodea atripinnis TaxID=208336 RepID=A0ABV0MMA4_9TELE